MDELMELTVLAFAQYNQATLPTFKYRATALRFVPIVSSNSISAAAVTCSDPWA
jgi:hypothetical protein